MKKLVIKILTAIVAIVMLLQHTAVLATSGSSESDLEDEKSQNEKKINDAINKKDEITKEKNKTVTEVENLSSQISEYESQIQNLDTQIVNLDTKISEAESNITKAEEEYLEREKQMKNRLIAIQEYGQASYLDVLLGSDNLIDFISNYFFVSELVTTDKEFLEEVQKQKLEIKEAKTNLETSKTELNTAKADKEQVSSQLKTAKGEKDQQVSQLTQDEKRIQQQIDEITQDNKAIDAKLADAKRKLQKQMEQQQNNNNSKTESSKSENSSNSGSSNTGSSKSENSPNSGNSNTGNSSSENSSNSGSSNTESSSSENNNPSDTSSKENSKQKNDSDSKKSEASSGISTGFIYPVPSAYTRITTGLYYSSGQYHGAVDFGTAGINGQPVYAVADGVVFLSENLGNRSYGNYIIIAHYNGLYTLYAHGQNGSRTVQAGDVVKRGQQIMRVGSTGNSTGPHLHFEVRNGSGGYNNRINPTAYLP